MARWLEDSYGVPDLVIASTATRVRETLQKMQSQWKKQPEVYFRDDLYLASPASLLRALQADGADFASVMLIAHNPGLEDLAQQLTEQTRHFPTAAMLLCSVADDHPWHRVLTAQDVQVEYWQIPRELPL
jgi:phosphohistidine phosphatase